jgi:hypothetical protein
MKPILLVRTTQIWGGEDGYQGIKLFFVRHRLFTIIMAALWVRVEFPL